MIAACYVLGPYCLIGGLAVNCYVEPVYTLDADLVLVPAGLTELPQRLTEAGFAVEQFPDSIDARPPASQLRIQFTTDERYRDFPERAHEAVVLEQRVQVASIEDVFRDKLWAWSDSARRM